MEKKEKKNCAMMCTKIGFWSMLALFILMILSSMLTVRFAALAIPSMILGILFIVSVFFVLVTSIQVIAPEKSMAYIALAIAIVFILYVLLSATLGGTGSIL